jgi:hypothetical protein
MVKNQGVFLLILLLFLVCIGSCTPDPDPYQIRINNQVFKIFSCKSNSLKIEYRFQGGYKMFYPNKEIDIISCVYIRINNKSNSQFTFTTKLINIVSKNYFYREITNENLFDSDEGGQYRKLTGVNVAPGEEKDVWIDLYGVDKIRDTKNTLQTPIKPDEELKLKFMTEDDSAGNYPSNQLFFIPVPKNSK